MASKDKHEKIKEISKKLGIPITLIGKTTYSKGLILYDESHNEMALGAPNAISLCDSSYKINPLEYVVFPIKVIGIPNFFEISFIFSCLSLDAIKQIW